MENTIISYNCDGKWANLNGLFHFINKNDTTIALLQDAPIPSSNKKYPPINNIDIIGLGKLKIIINTKYVTANLINPHEYTSENTSFQATKVKIDTINSPISIHNIYIRPKTTTHELNTTLTNLQESIYNMGASRLILMGDFNSISPEWCPPKKILTDPRTSMENQSYINLQINRGRMIKNFINKLKLTCLNDTSTGYTAYNKFYKTEAHIDLAIIGCKCLRTWKQIKTISISTSGNATNGHKILLIKQHRSSHKHIKTDKQTTNPNKPVNKDQQINILNKTLANIKIDEHWISKDRNEQIKLLNDISECVYDYLLHIQAVNTRPRRKNINHKKPRSQLKLKHLALTLKRKNSKSKKAQKLKKQLTHWINMEAQRAALSNPNKIQVWHKLDTLSELTAEKEIETSLNKNNIDEIMTEKFPYVNRDEAIKIIANDQSNICDNMYKIPMLNEIENAIQQIKNKRHTGHEGVKFSTFNKQIEHIRPLLIQICKISRYTSTIPNICKTTLGKIVPKKKKGQYRIVHLATPLLCLIEQLVLHQLEYQIEKHNKINQRQYGFTPLRDRHDLITRIIERVMLNKQHTNNKGHSTIVSLDIKGAFDNVDHNIIIKKLYETFSHQSSITKWISQFLLDKEIILEYKKTRSKSNKICKGVPQGSCLGPTLWNFFIEQIITTTNSINPEKFELLAYADDLIIIINNEKDNEGQEIINILSEQLNNIKLEIDPSKCSTMYTKLKSYRVNKPLHINNQQIEQVKNMSILGINIKYNLKLKTDTILSNKNLLINIRKLERANALGIINSKEDWNLLISSYIRSILVNNNFPLLAIDKTARKRISNLSIRIYKHIFDWPHNISQKLIKLILKEPSIEIQVEKLIYKKIHGEETNGYQLTLNHLKLNISNPSNQHNTYTNQYNTNQHNTNQHNTIRRSPNPELQIQLEKTTEDKLISNTWLLIERKDGSLLCRMNEQGESSMNIVVIHDQYKIGYFNNMAALTYLLSSTEQLEKDNIQIGYSKSITTLSSNALIQALSNFKNHDERIITLRENICDNHWSMATIESDRYHQIKYKIYQQEANITKTTIHLNTPEVSDYIFNLDKLNKINNEENLEMASNMTSFCRNIYCGYETWSHLNPSWLSGKRMLALTGLINKQNGALSHYGNIQTSDCSCDTNERSNNWVFHKAIECQQINLDTLDSRAKDIIKKVRTAKNKNLAIKSIIENKYEQQTLLRLICNISFSNIWT